MNKKISTYIDRCLIEEYADGCPGLDVSDISKADQVHFLELLYAEDAGLRDLVNEHMQELINARLDSLSQEHNFAAGRSTYQDRITGETIWTQSNFA